MPHLQAPLLSHLNVLQNRRAAAVCRQLTDGAKPFSQTEKKPKHNSTQLQAQGSTQPVLCSTECVGGTNRVGSLSYHRMSGGKTSPKIRENILHRGRNRGAIMFLCVGDAGSLKYLVGLEFGKK